MQERPNGRLEITRTEIERTIKTCTHHERLQEAQEYKIVAEYIEQGFPFKESKG